MHRIIALLLVMGCATLSHADQPQAVRVTEQELWEALDVDRPGFAGLKAAVAALSSAMAEREAK